MSWPMVIILTMLIMLTLLTMLIMLTMLTMLIMLTASVSRSRGPVCGVQRGVWLLCRGARLLGPGAQGPETAHLAGEAGAVVGHHRSPAQAPW